MNWQRIARRLLRILAEARAENKALRDQVRLEQAEVVRLGELLGHKAMATRQHQSYFWRDLDKGLSNDKKFRK